MILILALSLACVAIPISYNVYVNTMNEHYADLAENVADTAAIGLDGDKLREYYDAYQALSAEDAKNPEIVASLKDADYNEMLQYLYKVKAANDVLYLYVEVVDFDKQTDTYIMDADQSNTACELGTTEVLDESLLVHASAPENGMGTYFSDTEEFGPIVTSARPVFNAKGEVAAFAVVDLSMRKIASDRYLFLRLLIFVLAIVTLVLVVLDALAANHYLVKPINALALATGNFVRDRDAFQATGKRSAIEQLEIHTGDEIENLGNSVKNMEKEINAYIQSLTEMTAENERIGAELNVAKQIQTSMLPCVFPAFPDRDEFSLDAIMRPAKEVGGDFYDFFLVDSDHLALVIADVSGKGVPAALFMVIAKTLLKNSAQAGLNPKAVLEKVNNQLCENNEAEMFVTVWFSILQISTGEMQCANAGHEYPAIRHANGEFELLKDKHGIVLAAMPGTRYREYSLQLQPGDKLFVYTDGVTEATDAKETLYGTDRMLAALNRNYDSDAAQLLEKMTEDIDAFVGAAPQFDDITMLAVEFRCTHEKPMPSVCVKPELSNLDSVIAFLETTLKEASVATAVCTKMCIVADELFSNITYYSGASELTVGCRVENGCIKMRFRDNGVPYDPTQARDPDITLSAEERGVGGLGIFLVRKSVDKLSYEYRDGCNVLTLIKLLP